MAGFDERRGRAIPRLGAEHFKTYAMRSPLATHFRPATCEEVDCLDFIHGFVTTVDLNTELGQRQFDFLTHDKKRSCSMQKVGNGLVKFLYKPGNICMRYDEHRVPIGRPPMLLVIGGDWRGNPRRTPTIRHRTADDWVEDFATHQDKIATAVQRG